VRDPQDNYGAIIEYLDRDGRTMQRFFPDTLLHKRAGDLAAHLAEAGMKIVTKSYAREALQTFLNEATAPFAVYVYRPETKSLTEAAGRSGGAGVKLHRQEALCLECKGLGDEVRGVVCAGPLRGSD
jgi:hypothetical protein